MKKYNLSQIMKDAWHIYRKYNATYLYNHQPAQHSFADCLRRSWANAKSAAREFSGLVENVQVAGTLMHPVLVNVDMDTLSVTGNTYPARQMFREFGLTWDRESKAWTGTRSQLNSLCVKYAA